MHSNENIEAVRSALTRQSETITTHTEQARAAFTALFETCGYLWVMAADMEGERATKQWEDARANFADGMEALAMVAYNLDEYAIAARVAASAASQAPTESVHAHAAPPSESRLQYDAEE